MINHEILTKLWKQYWDEPNLRTNQRFGQFVFNQTGFETERSYYETNSFKVYNELMGVLYSKGNS